MATLLKNCLLADSTSGWDIIISDEGTIFSISQHNPALSGYSSVIDCTGLLVVPGLVDVHVHFREPGFEYKETILTGSRAAAHGGYTTVCPMPNLNPAPDSPETLQKQLDAICRDACIRVLPYATITRGRKGSGELTDHAAFEGLPIAGFSDDGCGVGPGELMEEAMRSIARTGRILAEHCEMPQYGTGPESEWREVERNIGLARKTGCAFHVCHVSTKESVQLVREAKASGVDVTCETGPHYLLLCEDDVLDEGRFRMNPPLRSREDMLALREGIADGTVDMIATDHAPHSAEEKSRGFKGSAMGIVGLETAFPVLYTGLVETGALSLERLVELMTSAPRARFGFEGPKSGCRPVCGTEADLAAFDLSKEFIINPAEFLSKGRSTPFEGWKVQGETAFTMVSGKLVYEKR